MVKFIDNKDIEYKDDREQDEANILLEILPKLGFWQFDNCGRKKQLIISLLNKVYIRFDGPGIAAGRLRNGLVMEWS